MAQPNGADALEEKLARLSKKAGVKAALVLDRATGAILKTSGDTAGLRTVTATAVGRASNPDTSSSTATLATPAQADDVMGIASLNGGFGGSSRAGAAAGAAGGEGQTGGVEEFARAMWRFVQTSESLVQDLDNTDEAKLLRLRTKKQEIVIVPDTKYLLVVIHDTPGA